MASDFRSQAADMAPRGAGAWLRDDASQAWLRGLGGAVSDSMALWREGVKVRFVRTAPSDALAELCDTRQIERAPRETEDAIRARLQRCFEIHQTRGTKDAYVEALLPLLVDAENIVVRNDYEDSIMPAVPGVDPWWSRVMVVIDSRSGPWFAPAWDDGGVWSEEEVWDIGDMTPAESTWLRRTIRRWKWAGAYPLAIVIIFGGSAWGLETVWSDSDVWTDVPAEVAVIPLGHVWGFNEAVYGAPPEMWTESGVWKDAFDFEVTP
jgi:hypothetical protein